MTPVLYTGDHRPGRWPTITISFGSVPMVFVAMSDEAVDREPAPNRAVRITTDVGQGPVAVLKWMTTVDVVAWGRIIDTIESGEALQLLVGIHTAAAAGDSALMQQSVFELEVMVEQAARFGASAV